MSDQVNYPRGSGRVTHPQALDSKNHKAEPAPVAGEQAPNEQTNVRRRNVRIEDAEQSAYIAEVNAAIAQGLDGADCIFSIPNANAAGPVVGATLTKTGRRAGVPDLLIAVPRECGGIRYAGCFLEMKRPAGVISDVSAEQREWLDRLATRGYMAVVVFGWREAWAVTRRYLGWEED